MAARNEQRVLYCGFRRIENVEEYFKSSSLLRGSDLYASNHVYGVREEVISANGPSDVIGKCVAQMKSIDYDVSLQLSSQPRRIVAASCTCKAGCRGWCKHAAALAVFVNKWELPSCTDLPCAWLGPPARPLLDTKKKIKDLFPGRPLPTPTLKPLCATVMLDQFPDLRCSLRQVLDAENCSENESGTMNTAPLEDGTRHADPELIREILEQERSMYHMMEVGSTLPLKIRIRDMLAPLTNPERVFYETAVRKSIAEIVDIELQTRGQSKVQRWHKERHLRIPSSSAHRIKTREGEFDSLAQSLLTPRPFSTAATCYGKNKEDEARQELAKALQAPVFEVGLVVHPQQPWLCCSPDGIIMADGTARAVEIKCPFSLRNRELIDAENMISHVKYIHYINGSLALKKNHPYYTQIMVALYVLNLEEALLFVYSKQQKISIIIERDEKFLSEYIPKLEWFYFKYMLSWLSKLP